MPGSTRFFLMACGFVALAACAVCASAQSVRPVPLSTLIDHDTQVLSFVCGGPLTPQEQQRFAAAITDQVRHNAAYWYKNDATVVSDLRLIHGNLARGRDEMWQRWRLAYAFAPVEGTRIAAAHDPVVAADEGRHLFVSEHTLRSLRDAMTWVAQQTGGPKPDAQYIVNMRNTIRQKWRTWPNDTLSAVTNIVQDFPASEEVLGSLAEGQRRQILAEMRQVLGNEPDSTLSTALSMSTLYNILLQQAYGGLLQTQSWALNQQMQRNFCNSLYAGPKAAGDHSTTFTQGTGAFCRPLGSPHR